MADIPADRRGWGRPCSGRIVTITPLNMALPVRAEVAVIFQRFILEAEDRGFRFNRTRDDWGYQCRHVRSDPGLPWSNHAWGLAVDLDATQNPYAARLITTFPSWIDELAARYGLRWGGNFTGIYKDSMHFEFVGSPADARQITARLEEDDMDVAELRREFTIPGGPVRLAVHELGRKAITEEMETKGSPSRVAVHELARRAVDEALADTKLVAQVKAADSKAAQALAGIGEVRTLVEQILLRMGGSE